MKDEPCFDTGCAGCDECIEDELAYMRHPPSETCECHDCHVARRAIKGAPLESYSPEDRAFYRFWYGHMREDLMPAGLADIPHSTARYIWDAALDATASPVVHPTGERTASSEGPPVGPQATGRGRMKRTGSLKEDGQHE